MKNTKTDKYFLVKLINDLTPLNNEWRHTKNAHKKIRIMWEIGKLINSAVKSGGYGFDELLRKIYDPHGKKLSYITRDLLSYCHRIFVNFNSIAIIDKRFKDLRSYTLFREAFPLLTNKDYNLTDEQKKEVIYMITHFRSVKNVQDKLKKMKQGIKPIKNSRTTKAHLYVEEASWLSGLRNEIIQYFRNNEYLSKDFPIEKHLVGELKQILLLIALDNNTAAKIDIVKIKDGQIRQLAVIANSKTEDKARFKKWGLDTFALMTLAEMLNAVNDAEKYFFVRQKIISQK